MTSQEILFEKRGNVGLITLNRPDKLNSLSMEMLQSLTRLLYELDTDTDIRCTILTGTGRGFSTGSDLGEASMFDPYEMAVEVSFGRLLVNKLEKLRMPVIAAVNGYAVGGGLEVAMSCDLRICSDHAKFGLGEVNVGTIAGWCGVYRLPELIGEAQAKLMEFTGKNIDAAEAFRLGLVAEVVPQEELMPKALELAQTIASKAPLAVELIKRLVREGRSLYDGGPEVAPIIRSEDFREAMSAFTEKRPNRGYNRR